MKYALDGTPISSAVPTRGSGSVATDFGVYRGTVIRTVYPDDEDNSSGERVEYVVECRGQVYPNAINMREAGGVFNYKERIRHPSTKDQSGQGLDRSKNENLNGESVFLMFLAGHSDIPLIIGADRHGLKKDKPRPKSSDGVFDVEEFNGIEFLIDKDSNFTITQVGRKNENGEILNADAANSFIKIDGQTGNIGIGFKSGTFPIEPMVLGTVLKNLFDTVFDAVLNAASIGTSAMGPVFLDPGIRAALVSAKQQFVTEAATNILSQFAFVERGES